MAADPHVAQQTAGALALAGAVNFAGPVLGPWLLILTAGFIGSFLNVLFQDTPPKMGAGARIILRGTLLAMVITAPLTWALIKYTGLPQPEAMALGAAMLGWKQELLLQWVSVRLPWNKPAGLLPTADAPKDGAAK
jgi:hypothetical protein